MIAYSPEYLLKYGGIGDTISRAFRSIITPLGRRVSASSIGRVVPPATAAGRLKPPLTSATVGAIPRALKAPSIVGGQASATVGATPRALRSAPPMAGGQASATVGAIPKARRLVPAAEARRSATGRLLSPQEASGGVRRNIKPVSESEYLMRGRDTFGVPMRPSVKLPSPGEIEWLTPPKGVPEFRGPSKQFRYMRTDPFMGHSYYNPRTGEVLHWDPKLDLELVSNPFGPMGYQWTPESLAKLEQMARVNTSRVGRVVSPPTRPGSVAI